MPRIPQDFYKQMGKQATPKEVGMAGAVGGIMGGAMGKMGGMAKQIIDALKKRKKPMPTFPKAPERRPEPPVQMPRPMPFRRPEPPIKMPQPKPVKELRDLKKQKRWAY
jgi:hypothetical protein